MQELLRLALDISTQDSVLLVRKGITVRLIGCCLRELIVGMWHVPYYTIVICSRHERLKGHLEAWMEVGQILNSLTSTEVTDWRWWVAFGDDSDMPWKRDFARLLVVNSIRES